LIAVWALSIVDVVDASRISPALDLPSRPPLRIALTAVKTPVADDMLLSVATVFINTSRFSTALRKAASIAGLEPSENGPYLV
jgi:hypothetical protein